MIKNVNISIVGTLCELADKIADEIINAELGFVKSGGEKEITLTYDFKNGGKVVILLAIEVQSSTTRLYIVTKYKTTNYTESFYSASDKGVTLAFHPNANEICPLAINMKILANADGDFIISIGNHIFCLISNFDSTEAVSEIFNVCYGKIGDTSVYTRDDTCSSVGFNSTGISNIKLRENIAYVTQLKGHTSIQDDYMIECKNALAIYPDQFDKFISINAELYFGFSTGKILKIDS